MNRADLIFDIVNSCDDKKMRVGDIHAALMLREEADPANYFNSSIVSSTVRQDNSTKEKNGQALRFDTSEYGWIRIVVFNDAQTIEEIVENSEMNLPKIISKANDSLRAQIKAAISQLSWQEFESSFLTQILEGLGFAKVQITQPTRDLGIDAICSYERGILKSEAIVSAKKWSGQKVSVTEVRAVRGIVRSTADTGVIITSSSFTSGAKDEAKQVGGNRSIILIDGDLIVDTCIKERIGVKVIELPNLYRFEGFN